MNYYFDLMGWIKSNPICNERKVHPFLVHIRTYIDLNGSIINEYGDKQYNQAMFRLREHLLKSENFLFLYDRGNTPKIVKFTPIHHLFIQYQILPFDFEDGDVMKVLLGDGYRNVYGLKFIIREIYPAEDGIHFNFYTINPHHINFMNAMRCQIIDEFLEEN